MVIASTVQALSQMTEILHALLSLSSQTQVIYDSSLKAAALHLRHYWATHRGPWPLQDVRVKCHASYVRQVILLFAFCEYLANHRAFLDAYQLSLRVAFGVLRENLVVVFYGFVVTPRALFYVDHQVIPLFAFYEQERIPCVVFYHVLVFPPDFVFEVESHLSVSCGVEETACVGVWEISQIPNWRDYVLF